MTEEDSQPEDSKDEGSRPGEGTKPEDSKGESSKPEETALRNECHAPSHGRPCHRGKHRGRVWLKLRNATVFSLVIHSCAGLVMLFILRDGLDTNTDFISRMKFLIEHRAEWTLAWLGWNAAALSILYFYFCFVRAHHRWGGWNSGKERTNDRKEGARRRPAPGNLSIMHFALALSTAAIALDLAAEGIQMAVLPDIAANYLQQDMRLPSTASTKALFDAVNRTSLMMTGCFANFLYTATATILLVATRKRYGLVTWISGALLSITGVWLSGAVIVNSVPTMVAANALLLPAIVVWQLSIAVDAQKRAREKSPETDSEQSSQASG